MKADQMIPFLDENFELLSKYGRGPEIDKAIHDGLRVIKFHYNLVFISTVNQFIKNISSFIGIGSF